MTPACMVPGVTKQSDSSLRFEKVISAEMSKVAGSADSEIGKEVLLD